MLASVTYQPTATPYTPSNLSAAPARVRSFPEAPPQGRLTAFVSTGPHFSGRLSTKSLFSGLQNRYERIGEYLKKKRYHLKRGVENFTVNLRKGFYDLILQFAAIFNGFPLPSFLRKYIQHKFFFSPRKVSSRQLLDSDTLKRKIFDINFYPEGPKKPLLNAWYVKAKPGQPTVVFSHGRDCNISHQEHIIKALTADQRGYGVFVYDYPGFGRSEGKPSETSLYEAGEAACKLLASDGVTGCNVPYEQQILMGHSLGGAVAINTAKVLQEQNKKVKALVVVNTFDNLKQALHHQKKQCRPWVQRWVKTEIPGMNFNSQEKMKDLKLPTVVMHGDNDQVIDLGLGQNLYKAHQSGEPKQFFRLNGVGHNLSDQNSQTITKNLAQFLKEHLI